MTKEKNYFWSSNGLSDAASNGNGCSSSGKDGASIDSTADISDATAAHSSSIFYALWWKLKIYINKWVQYIRTHSFIQLARGVFSALFFRLFIPIHWTFHYLTLNCSTYAFHIGCLCISIRWFCGWFFRCALCFLVRFVFILNNYAALAEALHQLEENVSRFNHITHIHSIDWTREVWKRNMYK